MISRIKIEQIVKLYREEFPMGWIDAYAWDQNNSPSSLDVIRNKVNAFDQEVLFLFAQSILSGEYLIKQDFTRSLDTLSDLLANGEVFDYESNQLMTIAIKRFNGMTYELGRVIRSYRYFLTLLNNKYEERQTKYIVNAYKVKREFSEEGKFGRLYDILLEITRIDHFLSYDKRTISDLIIFHNELTKAQDDENLYEKNRFALRILNEKCLFLIKKLLIDDNKEFDYMIDFKHKHYDTSKLHFDYFSELDNCFEFYRTESYSNDSMGYQLDKKEHSKSLPIGQFTLLMKYYKDSPDTQKMQIDNILKDFNYMYNRLSLQFTSRPLDRYALGTLKNYMYNCQFSYLLKNESYSFEQLQGGLNEIIDIQYQTGILNFYPYRKAFEKALQLLHANASLRKEELDIYKRFMQLCISKFSDAIQWCRANCFYPIQICYRECLVPVAGFGAVFVASSFCRPVRYDKLKDELNTFKNQALLVDNEIALREEKVELQKLKKDIDNTRTKEIEILSAFTAIITFLFGTIGFFADNKDNNFIHLVFSIFGLGAILLIFVSGIHLVTMRREESFGDYFKHPRAWFCVLTILASAILLIWLVINVKALKGG